VPPTVLFALAMQLAGALVWASQLEARMQGVEKLTGGPPQMNEKFGRLEERLDGLRGDISAMRRQVQTLTDRMLATPPERRP